MYDRQRPPELDQVMARVENAVAPIRTRVSRARDGMASLRGGAGPDPRLLERAAQSERAPADLKALDQAVRAGRTTWEKVASGRADHLPEVRQFYSASLSRAQRIVQRLQQQEQRGGEGRRS